MKTLTKIKKSLIGDKGSHDLTQVLMVLLSFLNELEGKGKMQGIAEHFIAFSQPV